MDTLLFLKLIVSAFFAILFLQSGLDKVFDWKGNLEFHKQHFEKSPLRNFSVFNLALMTILEVTCGLLCFAGALQVMIQRQASLALLGIELAAIIFTMLFFGQRISKDYQGAATIVNYFVLALVSIAILGITL